VNGCWLIRAHTGFRVLTDMSEGVTVKNPNCWRGSILFLHHAYCCKACTHRSLQLNQRE
jgi:uncharacterized protein (DUF983 family)